MEMVYDSLLKLSTADAQTSTKVLELPFKDSREHMTLQCIQFACCTVAFFCGQTNQLSLRLCRNFPAPKASCNRIFHVTAE